MAKIPPYGTSPAAAVLDGLNARNEEMRGELRAWQGVQFVENRFTPPDGEMRTRPWHQDDPRRPLNKSEVVGIVRDHCRRMPVPEPEIRHERDVREREQVVQITYKGRTRDKDLHQQFRLHEDELNDPGARESIVREPFTWLKTAGLPEEIILGEFKARMLDDTMKLWQESEDMRHCIYKSYTDRIKAKGYIAYHIDAPRLTKSGFTIGFLQRETGRQVHGHGIAARIMRNNAMKSDGQPKVRWVMEQLKGKANSTNSDEALKVFTQFIEETVNQSMEKSCG